MQAHDVSSHMPSAKGYSVRSKTLVEPTLFDYLMPRPHPISYFPSNQTMIRHATLRPQVN